MLTAVGCEEDYMKEKELKAECSCVKSINMYNFFDITFV
jgi:hypothetical protein